ncbi:amidohydrolase family protein [Bradyrhizobium sp. CCGUVB23]|uniref:amidohydrolase family protein n=1 Tax=Bradyrhizobium sp. CCGUVB23 TaxID=2949630 RepID=UPI0020B32040|nr:amidohydrolase family protein [Bradyrhizobium sp. CCGUVB23]MCP3463527.1 amidohydrolase [Bradyrhizobium sp. CCGUVB23]
MTDSDRQIAQWVEETPFVDTHEHLIEESQRLSGAIHPRTMPCDDWAYLFRSYVAEDLVVAGLPANDLQRFLGPEATSQEKYRLVAPYWKKIRHTGYAQALRHTFRGVYGENDLTDESFPRIAEKYRETIQPGFYARLLRLANIEGCHVNSLQRIFMETEQPRLLHHDISILQFCRCSVADFAWVEAETGKRPTTLEEWLEVIDFYFATYGAKAVAVKSQIAYSRALNFEPVTKAHASRLFPHHADRAGLFHPLGPEDLKSLQDYLFRYCVGKAGEYGLPVKLHTGVVAGYGLMQLARVQNNAADVCRLLQDFPGTRFVLMHIGYPYEHEFIALAKHYPNAAIDMCWAWIINPVACVRFLKEFLMAVPSNKIFTFGGDYVAVEPIYGHALIARRGIAQALSQLVAEGWIALEDTRDLIDRIMRGNALQFFRKGRREDATHP